MSFAGFSETTQVNKNWPFEQGLLSNPNDKLCNTMKSNLFLVIVGDTLGFVFVCVCARVWLVGLSFVVYFKQKIINSNNIL